MDMQIIVFDLETTLTHQKDMIPEIIEIGAVKIETEKKKAPVDTFQRYTFPAIQQRISDRTRKFIGLNKDEMPTFFPFREAFSSFLAWIGADTDYYLCTWGRDDKKLMIEHCARFGITFDWLRNYNDIQPAISTLLAGKNQMSLKDAIEAAGIVQEGRLHSALVDAIHTAHLLIKCNKNVHLEKNTPEANYYMASPLYMNCKACKKMKYYTDFGLKSKMCQSCLHLRKKENRPKDEPSPSS
jgi:inhibitor of KinA sporulation pathway (predicted exonuclease)